MSEDRQSDKAQSRESKKQPKTIEDKEFLRLQQAYKRILRNSDGLLVFRDIMQQCGFQAPSVVANPQTGEIYIDSTVYNEARRNLWLDLRKKMPIDRLVLVEYGQIPDSE